MKVKNLKVMQALRVGNFYPGETYFPPEKFEVEFINPVTIKITALRDSAATITTVYNAIQWDQVEETVPAPEKRQAATSRPAPVPSPEPALQSAAEKPARPKRSREVDIFNDE